MTIMWNKRNHKKVLQSIEEVYDKIGTILFDDYEELAWILDLPYGTYIKVAVEKLEKETEIVVLETDKGTGIDIIPF